MTPPLGESGSPLLTQLDRRPVCHLGHLPWLRSRARQSGPLLGQSEHQAGVTRMGVARNQVRPPPGGAGVQHVRDLYHCVRRAARRRTAVNSERRAARTLPSGAGTWQYLAAEQGLRGSLYPQGKLGPSALVPQRAAPDASGAAPRSTMRTMGRRRRPLAAPGSAIRPPAKRDIPTIPGTRLCGLV